MRLSNGQLKKRLAASGEMAGTKKALRQAIQASKDAFYESEADGTLSALAFLYQQSQWIHKRWWAFQGILLSVLWVLLKLTESSYYIQRYMGILGPLFAMLLLPELWKNRSCHAMEVECAAYYSLRQIYAARMALFAAVDFLLLAVFTAASIQTGKIAAEEMAVQFFLPYSVTCCICFHTLYSRKINSEAFALFLCIAWCAGWTVFALDEKIYEAATMPAWITMTALSVLYLGYCVFRGQKSCKGICEER